MSAFAKRALIVTFSPVPHLRERVPLDRQFVPAGKIKVCSRSILGPLGPFAIKICELFDSIAHRLVPAYLFGAAMIERTDRSRPAADQLPRFCRIRRCPYSADTPKFLLRRPQWAEARRMQDLMFGAAGHKCPSSRRASPAIGGLGAMTVSTAAGKVLTGSGPQRFFGYFLIVQKVTSVSPLPRRAEYF